ncbi:MAG: TonB-dependent receptor, partial [Hymenobacter sp.]
MVIYSAEGYKTLRSPVTVRANKNIVLNIVLTRDMNALDEIVVRDNAARNQGMIEINAKNFSSSPNVSQSFESLLKQLPGVSTNNELSSQYSVRGGNFDENLIYINDVEIFKPYLVRNGQQEGLSLINPDLAGNVKFSAGGFSARYGDKMSSVLDVHYKTKDTTNAIVGIGTNGISATAFSRFKNLNVALSYRNKRNQSILETQQVRGSYNPSFHDFQGIIN